MDYIQNYKNWLSKVSTQEKAELVAVDGHDEQLKRRFLMPLEFGTAGMRGIIALGTGCINKYTVARATQGLANYILTLGAAACKRGVVVSYDTRNFSYEFAKVAAEVLSYNGITAYLFNDVRPVPVCSFAVRYKGAVAGVMITASHNPKEYNGYKVYGEDGAQMSPEPTAQVVGFIDSIKDYFSVKYDEVNVNRNEVQAMDDVLLADNIIVIGKEVDEQYFAAIEKLSLSPSQVKKVSAKIKIVYTPIHGAGYKPVTQILARMGIPCSVVDEQKSPDGNFPTVKMPNPEQPDALAMGIKLAKKLHSDIVIGTDPDCDRMGIAIRNDSCEFVLLSGNQIGAMLMDYVLKRNMDNGTLPSNSAVVKTIVTTELATAIAKKYGATMYNVLTGFKFIGEKIKEWEKTGEHTFMFGYEESFGYLSGTHARDKDAVVAAMLFAEMACYYECIGKSLFQAMNDIFAEHGYFAEVSKSIAFNGIDGMEQMSAVMDKLRERPIHNVAGLAVAQFMDYKLGKSIDKSGKVTDILLPSANVIKFDFGDCEWACVRPSGTEPKIKIYVSVKAPSLEKANARRDNVLGFLEKLVIG